jgi:2-keto-4-pentenoate hydratase/2-oxohepta-3-ene-1,7-dioic acid hydratase in catechol pathway
LRPEAWGLVWLKAGDLVRAEVGAIGAIENRVELG